VAVLTIDLGNTRCKLRTWTVRDDCAARLSESESLASDAGLPAALRAWLSARAVPDLAAIACVASPELEREVTRTLRAACGEHFLAELDSGLVNRCREPQTVGRDRLFAARGAFELLGASALVLDAGTALTVDALEVEAASGEVRFLGGAIAPGPALLARALATGTARLPAIEPRTAVRALGRDTRGALEAGVVVGFRGAALELARAIGRESGIGTRHVVLTGGASRFLLEPPLFEPAPLVAAELVHVGLLAAALDRPRAAAARRLRVFETPS
jgi:type III pantothenate kinase